MSPKNQPPAERIGRDGNGRSFYFPADVTHTKENADGIICLMCQRENGVADVVGYIDPSTGNPFRGNPPSISDLKKRARESRNQSVLPLSLPPRLVSCAVAAEYVSMSANTFVKMVKDGRMPKPRSLGERRVAWDIEEVDLAVDRLPKSNPDFQDDNLWEADVA